MVEEKFCNNIACMDENNSTIYITGAGPGDPDLLTLKAKEIIESSEVIVYDNLVSEEVIDLALSLNPKVKLIYAGRVGYSEEKSVDIEKVCKLLLELSKEYKTICRLKGGDPNVFGRLGEEAVFLKEKGITFEIVPGIPSVTGVSAYSGIPLTHRSFASSFTVLTASEDPDYEEENKIRWENFDAQNGTLVLLMGTKNLSKIIKKLLELGRKKDTPLAIIESGTTSSQKTHITTIGEALDFINKTKIKTPTITVIGEVVKLKDILNWYESKPLFGKQILITREKEQSLALASRLIKCGAKPVICPLVSYKIIDKEIYNKDIINNISNFDWIFFTSQNAVRFFFEILKKNYYDSRAVHKTQIAVVGYKTKLELEKYNIKADFVPKRFSFQDLIRELSENTNLRDKKILYPAQSGNRHEAKNLNILTWIIYDVLFTETINEKEIKEIKDGIDIITLFSANTASCFYTIAKKYSLLEAIKNTKIATVGTETAKATGELFGKIDIIAEPFTEEGLITSMEKYFAVGAYHDTPLVKVNL